MVVVGLAGPGRAAEYALDRDVPYLPPGAEATDSRRERCRLDVYAPRGSNGFATVVWFHGGALKGGERAVPEGLQGRGIAVVAASYRLHPQVHAPAYLQDAAAAVA